ncbi:MAG: type I pantothenate kinase [Acidimicrobiia bacterium]|nr:type I pantothenate kinase [Acidimicrobiia bacterium]
MPTSRFLRFARDEWAQLRASTPMTLDQEDIEQVRGINEQLSMDDVEEVYLPVSRLLNLYVSASQTLYRVTDTFLGRPSQKVPYIIAVAGSVAVGKSTTSRLLRQLLARWPDHPRVELVGTDGFLHPNAVLEERGILAKKGFPESYDTAALLAFLEGVKAGVDALDVPVYSHNAYDIVPGEHRSVERADIVIIEGLNVLQPPNGDRRMASDFIDFGIFIDVDEPSVRNWYVERFFKLRDSTFQDPDAYFHRFASLSNEEAEQVAEGIWDTINGPNLQDNIAPTRERADLILRKSADHTIEEVFLRRL